MAKSKGFSYICGPFSILNVFLKISFDQISDYQKKPHLNLKYVLKQVAGSNPTRRTDI